MSLHTFCGGAPFVNGTHNRPSSPRYQFSSVDSRNLFPLPVSLLFSRVSLGFKLHCLSSSITTPTLHPKNHAGSNLPSILRILESTKDEDLPDETIDALLTDLSPKEQTVILNKQRDWRRSLRLFRRIKSSKDYSPNEIHYNIILRTLGRARRWDELRLCWIEMEKDGLLPSNNTYAILMDIYRRSGLFKEALLWLKHMKSRRIFPDEVSINTAVQVLKDSKQFDQGEKLFKGWCDGRVELDFIDLVNNASFDSSEIGFKHFLLTELFKYGGRAPVSQITSVYDVAPQTPTRAATYNTLIDLYGKAGRLKDASDAFSQMLRSGVMPDTLTFNTIINICCTHGCSGEAESLLLKMEERRVQPDATTFNIFMTYYDSVEDVDNVLRYYKMIREYGLRPDVATFRIILPTLCKKSMILEVETVIAQIMQLNSHVDEQSMVHVMKMYINKGLVDKASGFFEKHCYSIDISSKNRAAIMDLYAEKGYWKEAENVFVETRKDGSNKGVIEYNIMIKAFGKAKLYDKALELFESMRSSGPLPDECTYNSIIQLLSGGDFPEKARDLLIQMRKSGFKPRCETFCAVITSYCRAGFIGEAVETYQAMNESNVEPNEHVYGSLINAFAQSGRLDEAIEYHNIMEKSGIAANQIIITSMIKGYGKHGRWREAQALYAKLKTMGDGPDVVASNCMINLYAGLEMVHEAKLIFEELKRNGRADGVSYVTMMYLYKSMGMLTEAIDVAQEVQQSVSLTNCESYTIVMASYAVAGKLKDCGELLNHMLTKRIVPDSFTFKTLFTVLRKGGFPVEAIYQLESSYTEGKAYARQAVITSLFSVVGLHTFAMKSCEQFANGDVELESFAYNAAIGAYGAAGKVDKALNIFMRMQDKGLSPDVVTYIALVVCYGKAAMIEGLRRIYGLLKFGEIEPSESLYRALISAFKEAGRNDLAELVDREMSFSAQKDTEIVDD